MGFRQKLRKTRYSTTTIKVRIKLKEMIKDNRELREQIRNNKRPKLVLHR